MKTFMNTISILTLILLLFSCGVSENKEPGKNTHSKTEKSGHSKAIKTGVIINDIVCRDNPGTSYALYVPEGANAKAPFPVVFCFDPHAKGLLPVEKYKSLADVFGFVLAGSNNSKNGLPLTESETFLQQMLNDLSMQINIDKSRMATLGFSGGGRVAAWLAGNNRDIGAAISCGAGLPPDLKINSLGFDYLALVGNEDFNYTEIWKLNQTAEENQWPLNWLVFDGKHEWPPVEVMREAFYWIQVGAIKNGLAEKDEQFIQSVENHFSTKTGQMIGEGSIFDAATQMDFTIRLLDGLTNVSTKEEILNRLVSDQAYNQQKQALEQVIKLEYNEQNKLLGAFTTREIKWWEDAIREINRDKGNGDINRMNKRLVAWLGLVAYLSGERALHKQQADVAGQFITIYRLVEPENPEQAYQQAMLDMLNGQPDSAIKSLQEAVKLGFDDEERLWQEKAYLELQGNADFQRLFK